MAAVSIFDIFKIGIGPSSSHTVGPMKSARAFVCSLDTVAAKVHAIQVSLHGSLAWTGKGHGTDTAILLGLSGLEPETIDPDSIQDVIATIRDTRKLSAPGIGEIDFDPDEHIVFDFDRELPRHTNGMHFTATDKNGEVLAEDDYFSLGGGFFARGDEPEAGGQKGEPPHIFSSAAELLGQCAEHKLSIADLILENELT
ncbi:MAG: serine dehydratase beta chain, partial [Pseudomonadota bacterium]